ncbi:histone deacetylase complex subunit SAP18-like [Dysidea avara]|uniref:histone deacetylase complex subunit SAP18-like n=1 Tax=Dysidea avara TaxID=196820 RepID=UPI003323D869
MMAAKSDTPPKRIDRPVMDSVAVDPNFTVDREKTCPLLLRVFCNAGRHHRLDEFSRGNVPSNELQIYTWLDCTLRELMSLVKEVNPELRAKGTMFSFATIYPDPRRGGYRLKELGQTISGRKGSDDNITLQSRRFQIGDYLDVAVSTRPMSTSRRDSRSRPY